MKQIKLSQGKFALVDDGDYSFLSQWKWCAKEGNNTFYAVRTDCITGRIIRMHRVLLDVPNGIYADHVDMNGLNNQRLNIRLCTKSQNNCNRGTQSNNTSGYKGVNWHKKSKLFQVNIAYKNKQIYLGCYKSKHEAAKAYNKKALELHGEFAFQNII